MLLAGLQAQPIGAVAMAVHTDPYQTTRHSTRILLARGHIGRVRAAVTHWYAKALRAAHGNIRPHRARFLQQRQSQRISRHNTNRLGSMQRLHLWGEVAQVAIGAGILENCAKHLVRVQRIRRIHDHLDPQRSRTGLDQRDVLRVAVFIHKKCIGFRFRHSLRHGHRLGTGGRFVQKRRVGNFQPRQVGNHGLVI